MKNLILSFGIMLTAANAFALQCWVAHENGNSGIHVEDGTSNAIIFDQYSNELYVGNTAEGEKFLEQKSFTGYVAVFNLRNYDPSVYEVGIGLIKPDGANGSTVQPEGFAVSTSDSLPLQLGYNINRNISVRAGCF